MSVPFADIVVGPTGSASRPVVDPVIEGLEEAPQRCLVDTGAQGIRLSAELAEALGIELEGEPNRIALGGALIDGWEVAVRLALTVNGERVEWEAPVSFCAPWNRAFGLAGLRGFLDCFDVTVRAADEELDLRSRLEG